MLSRPTLRVASQVQKRAFSATRARLSSPYHYPEVRRLPWIILADAMY